MPAQPPIVRFEEHVGELELTVEAESLEELFAEAARFVARECGPVEGEPGPPERVTLAARDPGTLLVDWLNEMIGRSEVETRAYVDVRVLNLGLTGAKRSRGAPAGGAPLTSDVGPEHRAAVGVRLAGDDGTDVILEAEVRGRPVRSWESALKAATYHNLRLSREGDRWKATVLLDV